MRGGCPMSTKTFDWGQLRPFFILIFIGEGVDVPGALLTLIPP
jgi:hypothetical protein